MNSRPFEGTSGGGALQAAVLLAAFAMGSAAHAAVPAYSNQTDSAGLTFTHQPATDVAAQGAMGGGGSVGDFNNDGWPDLFVVGGGLTENRLFINLGDGTFEDRAAEWGLAVLDRGTASTVADYDDDGDLDIFLVSHGSMDETAQEGEHRLYRNDGGFFTDVAVAAGVNYTTFRPDGFGATFGDYDLDGDLDLAVSGWVIANDPASLGSRLFRNNGDGTFTNVTDEANLFQTNTRTFSMIFADMNRDRYPELLVAGDFGTSRYYKNNRDGTFTDGEEIFSEGSNGKAHNGMGTAIGDFDRDGDQDWFLDAIDPAFMDESDFDGNGLYINNGNHSYTESASAVGVGDGGWGWGTTALDFNHDGWLDLVMTNGWQRTDPVSGDSYWFEPSYMWRNDGGTFTEIGQSIGLDHTGQGRGLVHFDYDRDGDMDIVIFSNAEPLALFRNDLSGTDINWLQVELDTSAHGGVAPHGLGADVRISINGQRQYFRMAGGNNYLGNSELIAHFGLGTATKVDWLEIEWPDGFRTVQRDVAANQRITVSAALPFTQEPLTAGSSSDMVVKGLRPNELAHFFYSGTGPGDGPCYALLGGGCLDIVAPVYLGNATANSFGTATRTITLPANPGFDTYYTQVAVRRGNGGVASLLSNVITAPVAE